MIRALHVIGALVVTAGQGVLAADHGDLLQARERVEWDAGGLYEGRFSDGTPFQIELAYPEPEALSERVRDVMTQSYWYPRRFTGQTLLLRADKGPAGTLAVSGQSDIGAPAQERFLITLGADRRDGKGGWTLASSGKQLSFTLKRLVLYKAVALTRASPEAMAEGSDRPFVFSALFPVLHDRGMDGWVKSMVGVCQADVECSNKVTLRWHSPGLVSLHASTWTYNHGAAHGNYRSTMRHYATADGQAVHTRFTAFVASSLACRQKVSTLLVTKLDAQGLSWAEQGALDDMREPKFLPTPAGIDFHWDPYEVGSYAQGAPSVFLTRAELGDCARNLPHPG